MRYARPKTAALHVLNSVWPGAFVRGRLVLQSADTWLVRGTYLESSAYSSERVYLRPVLMQLAIPCELDVEFNLNRDLEAPLDFEYSSPAQDEALRGWLRNRLEPWLARYATPASIATAMATRRSIQGNALEAGHAMAVIAEDRPAAAAIRHQLQHLPPAAPLLPGWITRSNALAALAESSQDAAIASLEVVRQERLRQIGVPDKAIGTAPVAERPSIIPRWTRRKRHG